MIKIQYVIFHLFLRPTPHFKLSTFYPLFTIAIAMVESSVQWNIKNKIFDFENQHFNWYFSQESIDKEENFVGSKNDRDAVNK